VDPGGDGGGGLTATTLSCTSCGTELPPDSRFCNKCGTRIRPAATTAEYKQVTVLFADVVHSMDIAAAVGAERLREIMAELADRIAAVVQRFAGTIDKFTGDGIMAVFSAPVAFEDHAVRACLAALGVQEEAKRLAVGVQDRDGVDLRLRVGLNSGQVIAGEIGSGSLGYTTIGEQVGMAQRMESVAPPGGVMLSASTARLVDGAVAVGDPEMVRIKGAEEPVVAHRLFRVLVKGPKSALSAKTLHSDSHSNLEHLWRDQVLSKRLVGHEDDGGHLRHRPLTSMRRGGDSMSAGAFLYRVSWGWRPFARSSSMTHAIAASSLALLVVSGATRVPRNACQPSPPRTGIRPNTPPDRRRTQGCPW
jgi:class 3 adenylate cyclase